LLFILTLAYRAEVKTIAFKRQEAKDPWFGRLGQKATGEATGATGDENVTNKCPPVGKNNRKFES